MAHVTDVLFAVTFFVLAILAITRPDVILRWAKQAHPEYARDNATLLWIVRFIGVVGLGLAVFFSLIIVRSFQ